MGMSHSPVSGSSLNLLRGSQLWQSESERALRCLIRSATKLHDRWRDVSSNTLGFAKGCIFMHGSDKVLRALRTHVGNEYWYTRFVFSPGLRACLGFDNGHWQLSVPDPVP